jgi:hypothetical protein
MSDADVIRVVAKMIDLEGYKDSARTLYDIADRFPAALPHLQAHPDIDEVARAICGHPKGCQLGNGLCNQCKDDINILGVIKAASRASKIFAAAPLVADDCEVKP